MGMDISTSKKIAIFLLFGTAALFWPLTYCHYINFDDSGYVYGNQHVLSGLTADSMKWAFSELHADTSYWHPLTWLSHMTDVSLFGKRPNAQHLTNIWIHAFTGVILFFFFERILKDRWIAVFIACVFLIHPAHVESVAWISERKDVLCGFFMSLSLIAYIGQGRRFYYTSLACAVLASMSKPEAVILGPLLCAADYWRTGKITIMDKIPFALIGGLLAVITYYAQDDVQAISHGTPAIQKAVNVIMAISKYIQCFVWPSNLCVFYPYLECDQITPLSIVLGISEITLITWFAIRLRGHVLIGWLWFLVALLPVIGIVQVGSQSRADRYTYFSLIGLCIMLVPLIQRWQKQSIAIAMLAFIPITLRQIGTWKDSETLWKQALKVDASNTLANLERGGALLNSGLYSEAKPLLLVAMHNGSGNAPEQLAKLLLYIHRPKAALLYFDFAKRHGVDVIPYWEEIGVCFREIGDNAKALRYFKIGALIDPDDAQIQSKIGLMLQESGNPKAKEISKSVREKTRDTSPYGLKLASLVEEDESARRYLKQQVSITASFGGIGSSDVWLNPPISTNKTMRNIRL